MEWNELFGARVFRTCTHRCRSFCLCYKLNFSSRYPRLSLNLVTWVYSTEQSTHGFTFLHSHFTLLNSIHSNIGPDWITWVKLIEYIAEVDSQISFEIWIYLLIQMILGMDCWSSVRWHTHSTHIRTYTRLLSWEAIFH